MWLGSLHVFNFGGPGATPVLREQIFLTLTALHLALDLGIYNQKARMGRHREMSGSEMHF